MGAQLNITSEDAYRLTSRLSELTGESLTFLRHARHARVGRRLYGRNNHPATLNFGDGVAKAKREPLLFKGDDFSQTDIEPVLKA